MHTLFLITVKNHFPQNQFQELIPTSIGPCSTTTLVHEQAVSSVATGLIEGPGCSSL